jgi:tetratricopeptide (TPR) repeat protein
MATTLSNVGAIHQKRGDLDLALASFEQALEIKEALAPRSMGMASTLSHIGGVHSERGERGLALSYSERALEISEALAPRSANTAAALCNVGALHENSGNLDLALSSFEQALEIEEAIAPGSKEMRARSAASVLSIGAASISMSPFRITSERSRSVRRSPRDQQRRHSRFETSELFVGSSAISSLPSRSTSEPSRLANSWPQLRRTPRQHLAELALWYYERALVLGQAIFGRIRANRFVSQQHRIYLSRPR